MKDRGEIYLGMTKFSSFIPADRSDHEVDRRFDSHPKITHEYRSQFLGAIRIYSHRGINSTFGSSSAILAVASNAECQG